MAKGFHFTWKWIWCERSLWALSDCREPADALVKRWQVVSCLESALHHYVWRPQRCRRIDEISPVADRYKANIWIREIPIPAPTNERPKHWVKPYYGNLPYHRQLIFSLQKISYSLSTLSVAQTIPPASEVFTHVLYLWLATSVSFFGPFSKNQLYFFCGYASFLMSVLLKNVIFETIQVTESRSDPVVILQQVSIM